MNLTYLSDLWDEALASKMDEPELLRYRSNLLGSDPRITNFGGGNTSAKITETDPVTGESVPVLWVKGSGGDLGTITRSGFARLYQDKLEALKGRYKGIDFEDEMVALYPLCAFGQSTVAPSIDTPLHAFVPAKHVDHLHPDWAIALAASANGPALLEKFREDTGIHLVWLPWKRPGFELGLWLEKAIADNPGCDGVILGSHGIFTWGDTSRSSYESTLKVLDAIGSFVVPKIEARGESVFGGQATATRSDRESLAAALMPVLRGRFAKTPVGHYHTGEDVLRFVNAKDAKKLAARGTSCPDHFLRTKVEPLFLQWDAANGTEAELIAAAEAALPEYRDSYAVYYDQNKDPESPAMRAADPTVVLVPGVGLLSFGKNAAEARITGEFFINAIHVMEGATSLTGIGEVQADLDPALICDNYVSLTRKEAFNIEYWALEEAKLQRMPAEKEVARKVAVVVGAGPGIGRNIATRLLTEGAHVVCADIKAELAEASASALCEKFGKDSAYGVPVDITNRESVKAALDAACLRYGGIDILVIVAAVFFPPDEKGNLSDALFQKTFEVNVLGSFIAADEGAKRMLAQGSGGSIVLISSANAVVAKKGSLAYDTSKTALNHLVRELAVTYAPKIRVNAVAPATVVAGSQMFPKDRVIASLAKYNLPYSAEEDDEVLRERLADFYAQRTLLKARVNPTDIAEAAYLLCTPNRLPLTTGQVLPVDGGLTEAFLR
ncbi:MAG: bifunctional rhamnulose-1-phosphate aldolase/short-chain dehydrogenase [Armatimonas sp.]